MDTIMMDQIGPSSYSSSSPTGEKLIQEVKLLNTKSVDELRELMQLNGIKSIPKCSKQCVIADYLEMQIGQVVAVGVYCVTIPGERDTYAYFTSSITRFIRQFDAGDFPELIDKKRTSEYFGE